MTDADRVTTYELQLSIGDRWHTSRRGMTIDQLKETRTDFAREDEYTEELDYRFRKEN